MAARYKEGRTVIGKALDLEIPTVEILKLCDVFMKCIRSQCEQPELRKRLVAAGIVDEDQVAPMERTLMARCFFANPRLVDDNFFAPHPKVKTFFLTEFGREYLERKGKVNE